ncbi:HNH endonuclease signature motif containing protein [uncultured Cohaesibacter sp.]|uniref:HNH endonuclease signature motif containing protein n=1 Tax=uncultured Cohaesibacter sp. TaxID=1002546 RepID=UPI0029C8A89C|nr:HNH endonuclease signature motif containing protein [uncultured Cohaesibacter sp.]
MKGKRIDYSAEELAWIEANKTRVRKEAHAEFVVVFGRQDVSFSNYHSLCKRKGWFTGRTGRIEKGNVPLNKGKKMPFNANSARTQFKKGQLPHNTKYLGHERVSVDGYVEISVNETNPHTGYERRYVLKHRHLWELEHGPLPDGMCLKCLSDDKQNCDPSNWEMVPRGLLPRLNGKSGRNYDHAEPELKPVIMAVARLEHAAREARKAE